MNVKIQRKNLVAIGVAVGVVVAACSTEVPSTAPLRTFFSAVLNPASEVPAVTNSTATGSSNITMIDTNIVRVQTMVTAIDSVTQAHIHAGSATVAGPVMVFLLGPFSASQLVARGPAAASTLNGVLSHVDIIRGQTVFQGAFTFDSLLYRINTGTAYVNVHTRKNPSGEIRGQIVP